MASVREGGNGEGNWLAFVPPGGLYALAGVVGLMLALGIRLVSGSGWGIPVQLLLTTAGLLLVGFGISTRLQEGGTLCGEKLTGGVLLRLLGILGLTVALFGCTTFLLPPLESHRIEEMLRSPLAPGGGLPDGKERDAEGKPILVDGVPRPFPWMTYTYVVVLVLGVVLALLVSLGLLLKWAFRSAFDPDEEPAGEVQTSTGLLLGVGAVAGLLAYLGLDPAWDSGRSLLCVLSLVSLIGAMLIVLPMPWRKVLGSLLILLHFGGIATAVTAVEPPGAPAPWVATKLWTVFYRPYLQFTYMNNAYHFYSPEPGPASLLWARLEYKDGRYQWHKMPSRSKSPVQMYYQRVLAITESINQSAPPRADMRLVEERRQKAELTQGIPLHPEFPLPFQYREPNLYGKILTQSYVRHLAEAYPTLDDQPLERIKLYRVTHSILTGAQYAEGRRPTDPWWYLPYYQGEFSPDGTLLNDKDSLLYWLIPILPDGPTLDPTRIRDFLARHAGDR